jgi:hypothetical protein
MAISFIGSANAEADNGGDATITLPSALEDDLVIVAYENTTRGGADLDLAMITSGYTEVADLFSNDSLEAQLGVFYKVMGASPDTTAQVDGLGGLDVAVAAVAMVFRGVDTTTPMDVAATPATGLNTHTPDPPSIDWSTANAWTVIVGGCGHASSTRTLTFPTGYTTNAEQKSNLDATNNNVSTIGIGYNNGPSDPEDPGTFTVSGLDDAGFSWAAVTMALRPAGGGGGGGGFTGWGIPIF